MTRDGVVVIAHDEDLVRLCGIEKHVKEFIYDELPKMKRVIPLHFSGGKYRLLEEEDGTFTRLEDLFKLAPGKLISIDIKDDSDEIKHKVHQLIKDYHRESITIWGSMKPSHHRVIGKLNPNIP